MLLKILIIKKLKLKDLIFRTRNYKEILKMMNENAEYIKPDFEAKTAQDGADIVNLCDAGATYIEAEVGMTIEVEAQDWDEHFNILDLKMNHQECEGGFIEIHERNGYHFRCKRCDVSRDIAGSDADKEGMINAALKGAKYMTLSTHLDMIIFMPK